MKEEESQPLGDAKEDNAKPMQQALPFLAPYHWRRRRRHGLSGDFLCPAA